MKQSQMVNAYKVLETLSKQTMPVKTAYALHKQRRKLRPAFDFQIEAEEKLVKKLKPEINDGRMKFSTVDDAQEWNDEMTAIAEMESDIAVEPIQIEMTDNLMVSPLDIETLDGFVEFVE